MFYKCKSLINIDLSSLTPCYFMSCMFNECYSLTTLNFPNYNNNYHDYEYKFSGCISLINNPFI